MKPLRSLLWAVLVIPVLICGRTLYSQNIQWLPLPIDTSLPGDPLLGPNGSGSNPAGTWIVTNLPCYGPVLITQTFPYQPNDFDNPAFENVPNGGLTFINGGNNANGQFFWGSLGALGFVNTNTSVANYTITFYFLSGQPNYASLFLMGSGFASDTIATVSQPVIFLGEYDIPGLSAHTCLTNHSYTPGFTTGSTNAGTIGTVMGSYFNTDTNGDSFNTGLGLFQPVGVLQTANLPTGSVGFPTSSSPVPYLSLIVTQQVGDGIGFSLGYTCYTNGCTNNCITIENPINMITTSCSNCAVVRYQSQVTDVCCTNFTVSYDPPSGSCFAQGTNTVEVRVTDACGNSNSCSFTVTVLGDPDCTNCIEIDCSTNITVTTCSNSLPVNFSVSYQDICCSNCLVTVTSTPPSGFEFPIGTNFVTSTVTDALGNSNYCTFTVIVVPSGGPPVFGCLTPSLNFVPNGDFETYTSCPTGPSEINLATHWFQPTEGTPDYFNSCALSSSGVSVPKNFAGSVSPHSGNGYAGELMYSGEPSGPSGREYMEVPLTTPLVAGQSYQVSFYACLAIGPYTTAAIDSIGACLSVGPLQDSSTLGVLPFVPQVENPPGAFLTSTGSWTLVSGTFTAVGNEDHLTIGNFLDDQHTPSELLGSATFGSAYYYIDDVSVSNMCGCALDKVVRDASSPWTFDAPTAYDSNTGNPVNVAILSTVTNGPCPVTITRTWVATNSCGSNTCSQTVTVLGAPQILCTNIVVPSCVSTQVFYSPSVVDPCCPNDAVLCIPPSGSTFIAGSPTTVLCYTTNCFGIIGTNQFTVTVENAVVNQTNIVLSSCTNPAVYFNPTVTSSCCSNWVVSCIPSSGSIFDVGTTTTVYCIASDPCDDTNISTFTVTVLPGSNCCSAPVFGCLTPPVNYVPNGDFETHTSCPTTLSQITYATHWFAPTIGTPDYFNACASVSSGASTPDNIFGSAVPHSGNGYAGEYMYAGSDYGPDLSYREYMEVPLTLPLVAGQSYQVSFYVCLAGGTYSSFGIDSIGAYLSVGPLQSNTLDALSFVPQVQNPPGVLVTSTNSWTLISGTFTALGGEDHLTIGNFYGDDQTLSTPSRPGPIIWDYAYYYVDDVSVSNMCGCSPNKVLVDTPDWTFDAPSAYDPGTGNPINVTVLSTVTNGPCPLMITRTWVATNSCGSNTCSQTVTVFERPQILCTNIVVPSCVSTQLFYNPSAVDPCCTDDVVYCDPPSGSSFVPGLPTTVLCLTTNCLGVIGTNQFTVTVQNAVLNQTNIVVTSCTNVLVLFNSTVTSSCCSNWTVDFHPNEGFFGVGTTTTVQCVAFDPCGDTNFATFTVTVVPGTNCTDCLEVQCPTNASGTTCSNCAVVNFAATATNPCCKGPITLTYSPFQPGSCFPVGTTLEQVTAKDSCSNTATCNFNVTVTFNPCPPIISVGPTNFILCSGASGCVPMPDEVHPTPNFVILKNTGVSGGLSASGTEALPQGTLYDPHWTLVSVPALPPESPLEFGTNTQLQINSLSQWLDPDPLSAWIAPANDASNDAPEGDYDYQTTFVLPTDGPFTISGQVAADDYVSDILLNGISTGTSTTNGYSAAEWNAFTINGTGVAGTNTLDFIVHNNPTIGNNPPADNTDSPSGLLVEFNTITIATTQVQQYPPYNPAAVQATNCDGTSAQGWQSIPPGTILCGNTNITFVFTNECGDTTSYTATITVENCCTAPPSYMVLWLTFDETVGDICINSAGGNAGVRYSGNTIAKSNNGPSHNIGEYVNNSLCFNGTSDMVLVPDYAAIDFAANFSIDAWVKWNGGSGIQALVDHRSEAGSHFYGYLWFLDNGKPGLQLGTGPFANYVSSATLPTGVWTHLAVTVQRGSATGVKFYVNGSQTNSFNDTALLGSTSAKVPYLTIANQDPGFSPAPFDGCMDELEMFSRVLAPYEVSDIYGAFHAGKCRPTCSVPPAVTMCYNANTVTVPVEICNTGSTTQFLSIGFAGLSWIQAGGYPATNGPTLFSGPTYVILPPNTCTNFNETITKPVGLNLVNVAYYELMITDPLGQRFTSIGAIRELNPIYCGDIRMQNFTNILISSGPVNIGFMLIDPTNIPFQLNSQVSVVDGNLNPETNVVSLNGLPPGTPVITNFFIPPGGSAPVTVNVTYLNPQPSTPYYLVLSLNIGDDNALIPVASAGFVQSIPPTVGPPVSATYTNGQATITWDDENMGWTLLSTTNLASTNWIPLTLPVLPQPDGSQGVTLPTTNNSQFFQLLKPVPP